MGERTLFLSRAIEASTAHAHPARLPIDALLHESAGTEVNILLLVEGNAETRDSWSGVALSVVQSLRGAGHTVRPRDVDLHGLLRFAVATRTPSSSSRRWRIRYRLGSAGFAARSRRARQAVQEEIERADVVLQIGATFQADVPSSTPLFLYCDSNIEFARAGIGSGYSEASALTDREMDEIRAREADVYRRATTIFTMSDRLSRSFVEDFGISDEKLCTVHCGPGFDLDTVAPVEWGEKQPTVLFVGRDFRRKGGDILLEAFDKVRQSVADARLVMIGGKPVASYKSNVEYLGYLNRDVPDDRARMEKAFQEASVFCLPTRYDAFGTSFVEAMFHGLPCIGPDAWAVPEAVVHGETGFLVPPEDPIALAVALERLLTDRQAAERMGRAGRERAHAQFAWPVLAERMIQRMRAAIVPD